MKTKLIILRQNLNGWVIRQGDVLFCLPGNSLGDAAEDATREWPVLDPEVWEICEELAQQCPKWEWDAENRKLRYTGELQLPVDGRAYF